MRDIFDHPHYQSREMLVEVRDDDLGTVTLAGVVPKLSGTPGRLRWSGHRNGQDTREILVEFLGFSDGQIDALVRTGAIACDVAREESPAASAGPPAQEGFIHAKV
jgi:crotonobetainyl-CoA:carnitine CoA-transferase CaiB-like acyl-CoA transferase